LRVGAIRSLRAGGSMKAIGYYKSGAIDRDDALLDIELSAPQPAPRDLLVRVQAVSVNPVDTKVRGGAKPADGTVKVLGWDAAGIVEAVGSEVSIFKVGDEVYYAGEITRQGANAELHVVDERIVGLKPRSLNWAQAAALPLTSLTAWELLFDRLRVPSAEASTGQSLLIIGGAGGVGSILIQLACRLTGLTVVATASRPESIAWVKQMGAHHIIDHHKPLDQELAGIGLREVHYGASLSSSDAHLRYFPKIIAPQGHLALIDDPKSFDIASLKRKSITVAWEGMFTRSLYRTSDMIEQHRILQKVSELTDAGVLRTTLTKCLSPIDAANLKLAHRFIESGTAIGKIVLANTSNGE
jgi:zinc-binding alcohol dehydrogenase family protein